MPGERQTPTVRLRRLAAELRSLRTSSRLTRDEIVERTGINVATLYHIEHARVRPQTRTLRTLLALYGVEGAHQDELIALLRDARQRGWLHAYQSVLPEQYTTYIGFEGEARGVWNYESLFVPVEVAPVAGTIAVRDSKNPAGPELIFTRQAWVAFVEGVKCWPDGTSPWAGRSEQGSA
jgi:transcriptional regulator with XRE-family HTH domain